MATPVSGGDRARVGVVVRGEEDDDDGDGDDDDEDVANDSPANLVMTESVQFRTRGKRREVLAGQIRQLK